MGSEESLLIGGQQCTKTAENKRHERFWWKLMVAVSWGASPPLLRWLIKVQLKGLSKIVGIGICYCLCLFTQFHLEQTPETSRANQILLLKSLSHSSLLKSREGILRSGRIVCQNLSLDQSLLLGKVKLNYSSETRITRASHRGRQCKPGGFRVQTLACCSWFPWILLPRALAGLSRH